MFWDSEGVKLTHCISKSTTVTGGTYEDVTKRSFFQHCAKKAPKSLQLCFSSRQRSSSSGCSYSSVFRR